MTQEEKQLLLKDISARLPYGVYVHFCNTNIDEKLTEISLGETINQIRYNSKGNHGAIKPYLRPMPSMTEKEKIELKTITKGIVQTIGLEDIVVTTDKGFDWLNKNMFDYRWLIPMGLALEAPEGMYSNNFKAGHEQVEKDLVGTILTEIERRRAQAEKEYNESIYSMGRCDAYAEMRNFIHTVSGPL